MAYDRISLYAYPFMHASPLPLPPDSSLGGFHQPPANYYPPCDVASEPPLWTSNFHFHEGAVLLGNKQLPQPMGSFLPGPMLSTEPPASMSFIHHHQQQLGHPVSDPTTTISRPKSTPDSGCCLSVGLTKPDPNTAPDLKPQPQGGTKRRKNEAQRVLLVAMTGDGKQKVESPPLDSWAWRKYGQKPIKGSPYPRGYYRCSSSKGCPARKHVERSRSDSAMLIITYTFEHNHPWPLPRNHQQRQIIAASAAAATTTTTPNIKDEGNNIGCANALIEYQPPCGNTKLFSITDRCSAVEEAEEDQTQMLVASTSSPTHTPTTTPNNMHVDSSFLQDVSHCLSRSSTEDDDFFDDLGELPELSAIFRLCSNQRSLD